MEPANRNASWITSSAKLVKDHGSANVLSLEGFRRAAGDQWMKLREKVGIRLDELLRQQLGPSDFFLALDEMNRLIFTPSLPRQDGLISCLRIAYDLNSELLGRCRADQLTVQPAVAVRDDLIEVDTIAREQVLELASRAELSLAQDDVAEHGSALRLSEHHGDGVLQVVFAPVWDALHQVIRAYSCQPAIPAMAFGPENPQQYIHEMTQVTLDLLKLSAAQLRQLLQHGERVLLSVPVSYLVINNPVARMKLLAECRALDAELRPYLVFSVKDLPPGIPQSRVAEVVTILQAFCGGITVRAPLRSGQRLAAFRNAGVRGLGISLKGLAPEEYEREIGILTAEAKRAGVPSFVTSINDTVALHLALARGVQWLCGTAIAPAVAVPGPLKSLSREQLLRAAA